MIRRLSLLLLALPLFALELSVNTGKEEGKPFSVIHLQEEEPFLCETQKDDFEQVSEIICAFNRKPREDFKPLSNNFFSIATEVRGGSYFVRVKPFAKMELFPVLFTLHREETTFQAKIERSRHWMIVGYTDTMPLLRREPYTPTSINFPPTYKRELLPYVGGLDIKGQPIKLTRVRDVSEYIAIKRLYQSENYEQALELVLNTLQSYPDSIFRSELLLYQIRCYHHLGNYEELLEISKNFLRVYSSDENVPEVLAYTADAYSKIGLYTDADYFFDRLFMEHEGTPFATLGKIFRAEQFADSGNSKKALEYYVEALNESQDLDVAARAAYAVALYYLEHGQTDEAATYAFKIADGNPGYFFKHFATSREMSQTFADRESYAAAAAIVGALLDLTPAGHDDYQTMMRDRGIWLSKADKPEAALEALEKYLTSFPYGEYTDEVLKAKDALFFDLGDQNLSAKIAHYDGLMEKYARDPIADKALYSKAKLLMEAGRYRDVLDLNDSIGGLDAGLYPDAASMTVEAATELTKRALDSKACGEVIDLTRRYHVELESNWDEGVFECAYVAGEFERAKAIAARYIKSSDAPLRMAWLFRYLKADFETGNYEEAAQAAAELITLATMESSREYDAAYRIRFDALQRLGKAEGMIAAIAEVERVFGLDFADIGRYTQMVTLAKERKNSAMIETYAAKVMTLQEQTKSYTQSPYIEFTLTQALMELGRNQKAYDTVATLQKRTLEPSDRARAKYLEGSLLQKLGRSVDAKTAYEEAVKADEASAWGKLAKDALALML